jgi:hypothetical protein
MSSRKQKSINEALKKLSDLKDKQLDMWLRMANAYQSKFYAVDLFAMAALNRSAALCAGFESLIQQKNLICAASILRLQLDNAFRFGSVFLVPNPHKFASAVMNGKRIRDFKDKAGKAMKDGYLVSQISSKFPWVQKVYDKTCGYIHLSEQHLLHAIESAKDKRTFVIKISETDDHVSQESFLEAIEAFCAATKLFHYYVEGWIYSKPHPEVMARIREEKQKQ